jgi:hypothetical protein
LVFIAGYIATFLADKVPLADGAHDRAAIEWRTPTVITVWILAVAITVGRVALQAAPTRIARTLQSAQIARTMAAAV